jgi:hypothetical protein
MRADVVRLIDEAGRAGLPVTVLINNKVEGSSPHTAVAIANLVAEPRR